MRTLTGASNNLTVFLDNNDMLNLQHCLHSIFTPKTETEEGKIHTFAFSKGKT